jgi:GTP pyrophosphokinase
MSDNKEFMDALKSDLDVYQEQVYAFTPSGDIINLPAGSTPIDFAYHIHSAVGNKMVGARVNGKIVTFDYVIKTGDRIEVLTSQNSRGPSRDWLKIVKSSQARSKINQWFRKEFKDENVTKGKELIEKYAKQKGITISNVMKPQWMKMVQSKYGFKDWPAVCAAVGHGGLKEGQIVNRLNEEYRKTIKEEVKEEDILKEIVENPNKNVPKKSKSGIIVKGVEDLAVRFSKCCSPVPGDEIIGFITKGRGVSVHRTDCANMIHLNEIERHRLIEAEWGSTVKATTDMVYRADIQIIGSDRGGLLFDVSKVLTEENITVKSLNARSMSKERSIFNVTLEIKSVDQLNTLTKKLNMIPGIDDIIRTNN